MGEPLALAVDLGSGSLRAALVAADGGLRATASRTLPDAAPEARGHAEVEPALWWQALTEAVATVLAEAQAAPGALLGLAVGGLTRTQIFCDAGGGPLGPALHWRDTRASAEAAALVRASPAPAAGGPHPATPFHPVPRLMWLRDRDPARFARLARVLEPKDWLNARLTGRMATDSVSSGRLAPLGAPGLAPLAAAAALDPSLFPAPVAPETVLGPLRPGLPPPFDRLAGLPVLAGSMDTYCNALGAGANAAGEAYIVSGTSEACGLVAGAPRIAPGLITLGWGAGLWHMGGPMQAGAATVAWLDALLAAGRSRIEGVDDAPSLLAFPWLEGERTPLWDAALRGALVGLDRRHGADALRLSMRQGIAFGNRLVLGRAAGGEDALPARVRVTGGLARDDGWCAVKAAALGRTVLRPAAEETGLLGAALLVFHAAGLFPSLAAAQEALVRIGRTFVPDRGEAARLARLYTVWCDLHDALARASHALAAIDAAPEARARA